MAKLDLEKLLIDNPNAQAHADGIRKTLSDLKELRAAGLRESRFELAPPFGGRARLGAVPGGKAKRGINRFKRPLSA